LPDEYCEWTVVVNIVDDGSPHPADKEIVGIDFGAQTSLKVFVQPNAGVSAARNAGLDRVSEHAELIAYLDSDDVWPHGHLACGIKAYESGYDFYFCDNFRLGHYESYFERSSTTCDLINSAPSMPEDDNVDVPTGLLHVLILKDFTTHISTVIHAAAIATGIRFTERLHYSGEDVFYFTKIAVHSNKACFNPKKQVSCGSGVNIFYGSLNWDHSRFLRIKRDQVITYSLINKIDSLSDVAKAACRFELKYYRTDFVFHLVRRVYRKREKVPKEFFELIRFDPRLFFWFPRTLLRVLIYTDV